MGTRAHIAILVTALVVLAAGAALADSVMGTDPPVSSESTAAASDAVDARGSTDTAAGGVAVSAVTTVTSGGASTTSTSAAAANTGTSGPPPTIRPEPPATSTTVLVTESTGSPRTASADLIVAWQPSHQDDTGSDGWHEYTICGDIVQRTIDLAPGITHVLAWETGMGLTGSNNNGGTNRPAFDSELAKANRAGAHYFISVHNDGAAPSGVLGMYFVGDTTSAGVAERFARALADGTGLPYRGIRGHDLYSLDSVRNHAPVRILLEIGDNQADRAFLESAANRQKIAEVLADLVSDLRLPD